MVARHRVIWFWAGDADKADPALIPDFSAIEVEQPMVHGHMLFPAHYEIITDNLMDLSYTEFIHEQSFRMEGKSIAPRRMRRARSGRVGPSTTRPTRCG